MSSLEIKDLRKSYGDFPVLKGINLKVKEGEVYGLLGPNGAGKTTLFRTIMGLLEPDEGEIIIDEVDGSKDKRRKLGYLPSDINFYESMNAVHNLEFFASLVEQDPDIEELIELVGLTDAKEKKVGGYSTGMKKRLGIAQSLIKDPEIIIYDEPTTGLDPQGKRAFRKILQRINEEKDKTIILSSHVTTEIGPLCDRFGVLYDGVIKAAGTKESLGDEVGSGKVVEVESEQPDRLEKALESYEYEVKKGVARIKLEQSSKDRLLKDLAEHDVSVERFELSGRTLEDAYMRLTS